MCFNPLYLHAVKKSNGLFCFLIYFSNIALLK